MQIIKYAFIVFLSLLFLTGCGLADQDYTTITYRENDESGKQKQFFEITEETTIEKILEIIDEANWESGASDWAYPEDGSITFITEEEEKETVLVWFTTTAGDTVMDSGTYGIGTLTAELGAELKELLTQSTASK